MKRNRATRRPGHALVRAASVQRALRRHSGQQTWPTAIITPVAAPLRCFPSSPRLPWISLDNALCDSSR
jgi:hypothetical protein